jgi:hypothetical protein
LSDALIHVRTGVSPDLRERWELLGPAFLHGTTTIHILRLIVRELKPGAAMVLCTAVQRTVCVLFICNLLAGCSRNGSSQLVKTRADSVRWVRVASDDWGSHWMDTTTTEVHHDTIIAWIETRYTRPVRVNLLSRKVARALHRVEIACSRQQFRETTLVFFSERGIPSNIWSKPNSILDSLRVYYVTPGTSDEDLINAVCETLRNEEHERTIPDAP